MKRASKLCAPSIMALVAAAVLIVGLGGSGSGRAAAPAQADSHYFPETKHTVAGKFWQYWQAHGGLPQQGFPISDEMQERSDTDGKTYTVQYFERAVMEAHPEKQSPYDVLLSLLGSMLYKQKYPNGAGSQAPSTAPGAQRFTETGRTVGGVFLDYWKAHGGLPQQGFPISDEFTETSALDGKPYRVQYFERAVFEMHPEQKPPYNVLLSQLGTFRYQTHYAQGTGTGASDPSAAFAKGVDAYNRADYNGAVASFSQAIQASPQFAAAYLNRGIALFASGDSKGALADLDRAASIQPKDPEPLYAEGLVLYKGGNFDTARQAFSNLIQVAPSDPRGYYWRANVALSKQDPGSALDDFTRAARLNPNSDVGKQAKAAADLLDAGKQASPAQAPKLSLVQGQPPVPATTPTETAAKGTIVSDLGFRPQTDGFNFENYGRSPDRTDLTPDDVRRMFGDQVCASLASGCILSPEAQKWMDRTNSYMSSGHCEGLAALSLAFFGHNEDPNRFGAPRTHALNIGSNPLLQREIAYFWATQTTRPVLDSSIEDKTPAQILDTLVAALKPGSGAPKTYTISIYKPAFKDGHSLTPYAVEDRGNGQYAVRVYDNNFPDVERVLLIDRNANSWSYEGSINPGQPNSLYKGDASTLTLGLTPTEPRLQKQICDFCPHTPSGSRPQSVSAGGFTVAQAPTEYNQVSLEGTGHLLITDKQGRRTGYISNDQFANEIPGVKVQPITSANLWENSLEPMYLVPTGIEFSLAVKSADPLTDTLSTVTMIGPGYDLSVEDILLEPNTTDTINFSPDGKTISYKTDYSDSPDIVLGTDGQDADFSFDLRGVDLGDGGSVTTHLDTDKGQLVLDARGNTEPATYSLVMDRISSQGEQVFGHDQIELQPGDTAYLDYAAWQGEGTPLLLMIDHGSDGTIDETIELSDTR